MSNNVKEDFATLTKFWDGVFAMSEEDEENLGADIEAHWHELAPSQKLFDALDVFKGCEKVLDYGCGSGWASLIMAKKGVGEITACDVAPNCVKLLLAQAKALKVESKIEVKTIDENWLSKQKEGSFDGFFSSNVIDVIPLEMAKNIIEETARIVKEGAPVVFSLNYYLDLEKAIVAGKDVRGKSLYVDGVLRLVSLTDGEWGDLFKPYFKIEKLDYFAWEGEQKETRRLFFLRK